MFREKCGSPPSPITFGKGPLWLTRSEKISGPHFGPKFILEHVVSKIFEILKAVVNIENTVKKVAYIWEHIWCVT